MIIVYNNKVIHFPSDHHLPMQKTEPSCLTTNVPTDNQLTPFYIHAYNAYNVTQDTAALDAPSPPSNTDSLDNNQASESSLPPETTSLSKTQQDLLQIHHCFGHIGFSIIQDWACNRQFELSKSLAQCKAPICLACQYGSFKKYPHTSSTCALANWALAPSNFVSVDHRVSGSGGHIPFQVSHTSNWLYKYCTLWANHYSKFLYSHLQETATSKKTIHSKETYEPMPHILMSESKMFILTMESSPPLTLPNT